MTGKILQLLRADMLEHPNGKVHEETDCQYTPKPCDYAPDWQGMMEARARRGFIEDLSKVLPKKPKLGKRGRRRPR